MGAVALVVALASPAAALAPEGRPSTSPSPATTVPAASPRAWILVDAGTGAVLDAGNDRQALPPASLTKLLTALIATSALRPTDTMNVSLRAAGEPASKINMKPGQVWTFEDALYSMLLSSANDAAVAVAERTAGSLEAFAAAMQVAAAQLGLQDHPLLQDPTGLDNSFSVNGGNLLSARDIAIVARAVLAQPLLAQVVSTPVYRFVGPDGVQHRLGNHNQLLKSYPGAIGMKTGYTAKSGEDLIAAARRGNRTLIAVVLGAPSVWRDSGRLLDEGFALPPGTAGTGDRLPPVHLPGVPVLPATARVAGTTLPVQATVLVLPRHRSLVDEQGMILVLGLVAAAAAVAVRRRQVTVRRRRRRRLAQREEIATQWGSLR
ncbi:MAG TPA: hypothetical protein VGI06_03400 [Acidimicrobiales bacterium]